MDSKAMYLIYDMIIRDILKDTNKSLLDHTSE